MRSIILTALCLSTAFMYAQELRWDNEEALSTPVEEAVAETQIGNAGFYADYYEGNPTALGEVYRSNEFTAAHPTLPLGTMVQVTRLDNGMSTVVRINDRGAYCEDCLIDLSQIAAEEIDLIRAGRTRVKIQVIGYAEQNPTAPVEGGESRFIPKSVGPNDYQKRPPAGTAPNGRISPRTPLPQSQGTPAPKEGMRARGGGTLSLAKPHSPQEVQLLSNPPQGYAVQLGSYAQFGNAERHIVNLQEQGFNNLYVLQDTKADGTPINRVVVTPFLSPTEARNYLADLQRYHNMTGLVVQL